ncbi:hypothetical protein ES703_116066 [subsurface metagenome]|jgi:DNA-directed RNA polymerase sigma subunit (sigma70/sigma32)
MKNESYEGMTIRVPVDIARQLKELRKTKNLSSYGSALKYWIEQQHNEQIEARLNHLEEQVTKLPKRLAEMIVLHEKLIRK